jgi:hypothetical protein
MGVPREYEYEYSEDRIGIVWGGAGLGMGVESSGLCGRGKFVGVGVESAWKFRVYAGVESSRVCGRGKCVESSRGCEQKEGWVR